MLSFLDLFASLNRNEVRYLLVGGLAVNLYGIERATGDIDLVIDVTEENIRSFSRSMHEVGMCPRAPVRIEDFGDPSVRRSWIDEKGMRVFSLFHPQQHYLELDVFVECPFDFSEVYGRREVMGQGAIKIAVAPIDILIAMKEAADRPQDRADVYHLRQIKDEL